MPKAEPTALSTLPEIVTLDHVVSLIGEHRKTILKRIREGKFAPHVRQGRRFIWTRRGLLDWLDRNASPSGEPPYRRTRRAKVQACRDVWVGSGRSPSETVRLTNARHSQTPKS